MSGGWWRRNRWGLVALLPALLGASALDLGDGYDRFWNSQPRAPVGPGADGWVAFAGARVRLAALAPAEDLREYGGQPFAPPPGVRVWRAAIAFDGAAPGGALAGCRLLLEDAAGRTFDAGPTELRRARTPIAGCTPPSGARGPYETVAYFVTPAGARPVAVRVVLFTKLPAYARLTAG